MQKAKLALLAKSRGPSEYLQDPMTTTAAVRRKGKGRLDWGPCPQTPRIYRIVLSQAKAQNRRGEPRSPSSLVQPRSRRSGCIPAEPYPPPRSTPVYPNRARGPLREPEAKQKRKPSRGRVSSPHTRLSGSPRIGIKTRFQAHSPLESNIDFRLTFGLENAEAEAEAYRRRVCSSTAGRKL